MLGASRTRVKVLLALWGAGLMAWMLWQIGWEPLAASLRLVGFGGFVTLLGLFALAQVPSCVGWRWGSRRWQPFRWWWRASRRRLAWRRRLLPVLELPAAVLRLPSRCCRGALRVHPAAGGAVYIVADILVLLRERPGVLSECSEVRGGLDQGSSVASMKDRQWLRQPRREGGTRNPLNR